MSGDARRLARGAALPLEFGDDVQPNLSAAWLVKGLLPATGLAILHGHPGSGKSFLALDLAARVADGRDWNGRRVVRGAAIYLAAEGGTGLRNRIAAWRQHHGAWLDALGLVPAGLDLSGTGDDAARVVDAARTLEARCSQPVRLLVVDTISRTLGQIDENGPGLAAYVATLGRLGEALGCLVLAVHHRPKSAESSDPRGHSSLKAAADAVLLVDGDTGARRVTCQKMKDAEAAAPFGFELRRVELGRDEDGDPVTSCVVEAVEGSAAPVSVKGRRLTDKQQIALAALEAEIAASGEYPPADLPEAMARPGVSFRVALFRAWRERARAMGDAEISPENFRRGFALRVESLQAAGIVHVWKDYAWPATR